MNDPAKGAVSELLRKTLERQHKWHLDQTERTPVYFGDTIGQVDADEYQDSELCDITVRALATPSTPGQQTAEGMPSQPEAQGTPDVALDSQFIFFNGGQQCDALIGPCACGATHRLEDIQERFASLYSAQQQALATYIAKLDATQQQRDALQAKLAEVEKDKDELYEAAKSESERYVATAAECDQLAAAVAELRKVITDLWPFVAEDYHPDFVTPEYKAAVEAAKAVAQPGTQAKD